MLKLAEIKKPGQISILTVLILLLAHTPSVAAQGLSQAQIELYQQNINYFDTGGGGDNCSASGTTSGGSLDAWMQAEAIAESTNNPTENSGNGAYGKYQITGTTGLPGTWQLYAAQYYPPALQYANASVAPEDIQDAVTYLAGLTPYKNFGGDPFWMAVNWYDPPKFDPAYPNKNSPLLDVAPNPGLTGADYGSMIANAVKSGTLKGISLSSVSLSYQNAPQFQQYLTKDGGPPSGSTTIVGGSVSNSCSTSSTGSCQIANSSQPVTGPNAAILCEAEKYAGIYYSWGGGHGYTAFRQACPENSITSAAASSTGNNPGPCGTDCSGLVDVAVDAVYNKTFDWAVSSTNGQMIDSPSQYWESIPFSEAQAGDIVTHYQPNDGHVEIVEYVSGSTVYTFGSHYTGTQTGPTSGSTSYYNGGAWRYVPGGTGG